MNTLNPIEFCAAAAIAGEVARLEGLIDLTRGLIDRAAPARECLPLMRGLETILEDLLLTADEARDRLAECQAVSAAGAMAQLFAAIRDIRVGDDAEVKRAKALEARAHGFSAQAGGLDAASCGRLSQTRFEAVPRARQLAAG
jgi:hypothetical protein